MYSVNELAQLLDVSTRTMYLRLQKIAHVAEVCRVKQGKKVYYKKEVLESLGIMEQTQLKNVNDNELQKANDYLTLKLNDLYETISELKQDKSFLQGLTIQQAKTIEQQNKSIERAQSLNYLDKPKKD